MSGTTVMKRNEMEAVPLSATTPKPPAAASEEAVLIEQGYRGYNIVLHRDQFIALAVSLAGQELSGLTEAELRAQEQAGNIVLADSLAEIKRRIDALGPTVLDADFQGFRLVLYRNRCYGIAHALGDVDIATLDPAALQAHQQAGTIILAPCTEQTQQRIIVAEAGAPAPQGTQKARALMLGTVPAEQVGAFLHRVSEHDVTLLAPATWTGAGPCRTLPHRNRAGQPTAAFDSIDTLPEELERLKAEQFEVVFIPYMDRLAWNGRLPERLGAALARKVVVLFANGDSRTYEGEDLNRIQYNRAYLDTMFRFVPPLKGCNILEIGCSDGLACDLLLTEEPHSVVGVDVCEAPGSRFHDPRLNFAQMDAGRLQFPDKHFDLVYSIAVLEHCPDPSAVLQEMKRVTKPGGYVFAQAGPLYYSPFGHHMFGYFDKYPWVHLRLTPEQIISGARVEGIADRLKAETGRDIEEYIGAMLNPRHINGKSLPEYGLTSFVQTDEIEVLHFAISREGENLLTEDIVQQLASIGRENLVTHGFELVFRVL